MKSAYLSLIVGAALFLGLATTSADILTPGGDGSLGTVNYLGGNIGLNSSVSARGGSTTSSIDGASTFSTFGTVTANGNDGAGQGQAFAESHSWHIDSREGNSTLPTFFNIDLGDVAGVANAGTQEFAISQISVYNRQDGFGTQFNGDIAVVDRFGQDVSVSVVNVDGLTIPQGKVSFNFGGLGEIGQAINYRNMASFTELEVFGLSNFNLTVNDSLALDISSSGNDFVNVQGNAVLAGAIDISTLDAFVPTSNNPTSVLTATSINTDQLSLSEGFGFQVVSGGNGQVLEVFVTVPEASSLVLLALSSIFFFRKRNLFPSRG